MNYLLSGSEAYRLNERRKQIIKETVGTTDEMAVSVYNDIEGCSIDAVIDDCIMFSFFSEKKVVIYEDPSFIKVKKTAPGNKENSNETVQDSTTVETMEKVGSSEDEKALKRLTDYLSNPNEATTLIIIVNRDIGKNAVFTRLCKQMLHEEFGKVKPDEFKIIVRSDLQNAGLKLDNLALNELFNRLPLDIENWKRELEKLLLYPERITKETITQLISKPLEDNVMNLSNAVVNKRLSEALAIYHDLLVNDKYVSIPLIGLLASSFRFMCQVRILYEHHYSLQDMCAELNVNNPYRITITMESSQNKTSKDYLKLLNELSDLDQKVKTGQIDAVTGLELFIINSIRG